MRAMQFTIFLALSAAPTAVNATPSQCARFMDAAIVSNDGKFLGRLSSKYDNDSIFNKYGTYGSKYSSDSIWNKYSDYGSPYGGNSPFNPYSAKPPLIIKGGEAIAILSKNKRANGAVDPVMLAVVCFDFAPD